MSVPPSLFQFLPQKCSIVECRRRGKHREVETYGYQGLLTFGSSELVFWRCDKHARTPSVDAAGKMHVSANVYRVDCSKERDTNVRTEPTPKKPRFRCPRCGGYLIRLPSGRLACPLAGCWSEEIA